MTDQERLKQIAGLFGGVNELAKAAGYSPSGMSRRISGGTKITGRDWLCVKAAISERVSRLSAVLEG